MIIREATVADVPAITGIYNQAVVDTTASFDLEPKSVEDRTAWFESHGGNHPVFVAEEAGVVVGWSSLSAFSARPAYDTTAEISVYIDRDHHRRGLGRLLSLALLEAAPSVGIHSILARICTENVGSIAMVRALGFTEAGTIHEAGYKFDRWLDVVTWEYILS